MKHVLLAAVGVLVPSIAFAQATWQWPQAILQARFAKIGVQLDF